MVWACLIANLLEWVVVVCFTCLFVYGCLFACLLVYLLVYVCFTFLLVFAGLVVRLFASVLVYLFIYFCMLVCLFVSLFVWLLVCLLDCSFLYFVVTLTTYFNHSLLSMFSVFFRFPLSFLFQLGYTHR